MMSPYYRFAQTYGAGNYSTDAYSAKTTTGTSSGGNTASSGGGSTLIDTGIAVILVVSLAAALLCVSMIVRFVRRPAKVPAIDPEDLETNQNNT